MGFLVFTFSLHHCFLAGTQYNPKLGNYFHLGEKLSKVSILVLTLGMGTCPPHSRKSWDTPITFCLFVWGLFYLFFLSLYTSVSKQFCGAGTTFPIGIKTVREENPFSAQSNCGLEEHVPIEELSLTHGEPPFLSVVSHARWGLEESYPAPQCGLLHSVSVYILISFQSTPTDTRRMCDQIARQPVVPLRCHKFCFPREPSKFWK